MEKRKWMWYECDIFKPGQNIRNYKSKLRTTDNFWAYKNVKFWHCSRNKENMTRLEIPQITEFMGTGENTVTGS
jgi:hypothetical protein